MKIILCLLLFISAECLISAFTNGRSLDDIENPMKYPVLSQSCSFHTTKLLKYYLHHRFRKNVVALQWSVHLFVIQIVF